MTTAKPEGRRRKTARCPVCKEKFKISPRGRPPTFCGRSCRQRAYEQRKWSRPHPVELLARDIASARVRDFVREQVREFFSRSRNYPPPSTTTQAKAIASAFAPGGKIGSCAAAAE